MRTAGNGPSLVAIHGFLAHSSTWGTFSDYLEQHFTVHYIDLPGHGQSPPISTWTTLNELAEIVRDFLYSRNITTAYILGHSLGGYIAVELVCVGYAASGLALLNSFPYVDSEPKRQQRKREIELIKQGRATTVYALLIQSAMEHISKDVRNIFLAAANCVAPQTAAHYLRAIVHRPKHIDFLLHYTRPYVAIHGDDDSFKKSGIIPDNVPIHVLEHTGHYSFIEQPQRCAELVSSIKL
ncbi:MAG: alpha/beta fold hydrolase [Bacteroidota bacterium]